MSVGVESSHWQIAKRLRSWASSEARPCQQSCRDGLRMSALLCELFCRLIPAVLQKQSAGVSDPWKVEADSGGPCSDWNMYFSIICCWGQKVFWPLWHTDCFAFHAPAILKHLKFAHFSTKNGYFSVFCGSISHAFSCKHETHDLLTLVSNHKRSCLISPL